VRGMSEGRVSTVDLLLVEDSATQATALSLQLEEAGFSVRVASSLQEARERLVVRGCDVVILDLELPDATGLEGLVALQEEHATIPVVVLTSEHGEELAIEALQRGAEDYAHKEHLDLRLLRRSLQYAIERHRTRNELTELTLQLRDKARELEELNLQKDHMMGVAAHDMRNPLSVVRGYGDFLLSGGAGDLNDEQEHIIQLVRRTSDYMLQLVEDLVDFSRIQAGAMTLEREEIDLVALVRQTVQLNTMLARDKAITVEADLPDALPPMALDRHKMRQVLDNLLTNAVKFSHEGSAVDVTLAREDEMAHLAVRDRGVGIPEEELPRVFRPFEKTSARPTRGERSTGLGLAIVRNIVRAHGGRIWVESRVGEGSTFHVALPLTPAS